MRPRVWVNCAASADGKIATIRRTQTRLSSSADLDRVERLRGESDAIMVGISTVITDDPGLMPPRGSKRPLLRVIVDSKGRTPRSARVLDGKGPTLIATTEESTATFAQAETVRFGKGRVDLAQLLDELGRRNVKQVLVEGGGTLIFSLLQAGLVDDLTVFYADLVLGGRGAPTIADGEGFPDLGQAVKLHFKESKRLDGGTLMHYQVGTRAN